MKAAHLLVCGDLFRSPYFKLPTGFNYTEYKYDYKVDVFNLALTGPFPEPVEDGSEVDCYLTKIGNNMDYDWQWVFRGRTAGAAIRITCIEECGV